MRRLSFFLLLACCLVVPLAVAAEEAPDDAPLVMPQGWVFVESSPGGFIMEHGDGTRVQVTQSQCGNGYRVGVSIDHLAGGRRMRDTVFLRATGQTDMTVRIRLWPNGRRELISLGVPWPEDVRQAFLRLLDPATRSVIHNE